MADKKFDLSAMIDSVSKLDTSAAGPQMEMIRLEDIVVNKDNFYQLTNLGPLADSIAMDGLQQPLVVTAHSSKEGKYLLISGHRRRAAIEKLVKEDHREDLNLVPCMVKSYASPAMAELQLILANSTTRVLSNAEISKQAEKMETLLYQLKEEGYEFPGRMRDQVAAACRVSGPKLARLKVIREKLHADFMYLFEKDKLAEQTAYALARMPVEFQSRISKLVGPDADKLKGGGVEQVLKKYEDGWRWEPDLKCPDGKACPGGDRFLRHDLDHPYDMCCGEKCCLNCEGAKAQYYPCDRMCSKAQALRKEKRDDGKEKEEARLLENAKKYQAETQQNAQRLLRAIAAAGLPDESKFSWQKYWNTIQVSDVRRWAAGEFTVAEDRWTQPELDPKRLNDPTALSQLFGCSTDFLLGLTDELSRPELSEAAKEAQPKTDFLSGEPLEDDEEDEQYFSVRWLDGSPQKSGKVAVLVEDRDGDLDTRILWYNAEKLRYQLFRFMDSSHNEKILGWWPLPDEPEGEAE